MKASNYICEFLHKQGVATVFELSGGMITHLLDSISKQGRIQCVSMHHEQGAAFAADAMGRMTGIPGVALATSGPGATNLLTGIGSCYFDSSPAVFITGQVNRNEQKGDKLIRQLGFQETDIVSMAAPITKAAWRVKTPEELPSLLSEAFALAVEGRPGPVLLDIPMDVQRTEINIQEPTPQPALSSAPIPSQIWKPLFEKISCAKRPLILAGGGIRAARAIDTFRKLVERVKLPVVNSLMAVDCLPHAHPLRVGLIGTYGNRWANLALGESDLLIVLGSRLDVRQTGSIIAAFKANREIYHIDCDEGEIQNNRVKGCEEVRATLSEFLTTALRESESIQFETRSSWLKEIADLKKQWPDDSEQNVPGINPNWFVHKLTQRSPRASAIVVDVGQHQMWAAQSSELNQDQRFITSGGMGAMGFALPAAIGVAFAATNRPVVVIAGDGGFQCNIQELQTIARNKLPVKIVILNNGCHGMVRQFQESYFAKRYQSTLVGYSAPSFPKVAEAYGLEARTLSSQSDVNTSIDWLWSDETSPRLLDVMIDLSANAYPKIAFGQPITQMEPFSARD